MRFTIVGIVMIQLFMPFSVLPVSARPPSEIIIETNAENDLLIVDVKHVSRNIRDHFIRRMYVFLNDEKVESFSYPAQQSPPGFSEEISLKTKSGDVIRVETICSNSGKDTFTYTLP